MKIAGGAGTKKNAQERITRKKIIDFDPLNGDHHGRSPEAELSEEE